METGRGPKGVTQMKNGVYAITVSKGVLVDGTIGHGLSRSMIDGKITPWVRNGKSDELTPAQIAYLSAKAQDEDQVVIDHINQWNGH